MPASRDAASWPFQDPVLAANRQSSGSQHDKHHFMDRLQTRPRSKSEDGCITSAFSIETTFCANYFGVDNASNLRKYWTFPDNNIQISGIDLNRDFQDTKFQGNVQQLDDTSAGFRGVESESGYVNTIDSGVRSWDLTLPSLLRQDSETKMSVTRNLKRSRRKLLQTRSRAQEDCTRMRNAEKELFQSLDTFLNTLEEHEFRMPQEGLDSIRKDCRALRERSDVIHAAKIFDRTQSRLINQEFRVRNLEDTKFGQLGEDGWTDSSSSMSDVTDSHEDVGESVTSISLGKLNLIGAIPQFVPSDRSTSTRTRLSRDIWDRLQPRTVIKTYPKRLTNTRNDTRFEILESNLFDDVRQPSAQQQLVSQISSAIMPNIGSQFTSEEATISARRAAENDPLLSNNNGNIETQHQTGSNLSALLDWGEPWSSIGNFFTSFAFSQPEALGYILHDVFKQVGVSWSEVRVTTGTSSLIDQGLVLFHATNLLVRRWSWIFKFCVKPNFGPSLSGSKFSEILSLATSKHDIQLLDHSIPFQHRQNSHARSFYSSIPVVQPNRIRSEPIPSRDDELPLSVIDDSLSRSQPTSNCAAQARRLSSAEEMTTLVS